MSDKGFVGFCSTCGKAFLECECSYFDIETSKSQHKRLSVQSDLYRSGYKAGLKRAIDVIHETKTEKTPYGLGIRMDYLELIEAIQKEVKE